MSTTAQHTAAALAAVNRVVTAAIPTETDDEHFRAYRLDDVAALAERPKQYAEIICVRRLLPDPRVTPLSSMQLWRCTAWWIANTVGNASLLEGFIMQALEHQTLTIGGVKTTPLQHEVTEPTAQDERGTWVGYVDLTYAI